MKTHVIILCAALLPVLAIVWHRQSQCDEAAGNVRLVDALRSDRQSNALLKEGSVVHLKNWLSDHPSHPQAVNVRQILRLRADPQRGPMGLDALLSNALLDVLTR